jgi:hypothetical protein|tara:strand:+ start:2940 stop:3212 length:273 start_codon:yes stop_codon:yes gene_type:complete
MRDHPETHVVEIDRPKGLPLHIKGLFFRGKLKWVSVGVPLPEKEGSTCEWVGEDDSLGEEVFEKVKELLHRVFTASEEVTQKIIEDNGRH